MTRNRPLLGAAVLYLLNATAGTALALRDGLVAEPLGIRTGLPVARELVLGIGTAVSAPPPMLVGLVTCLPGVARGDRRATAILAGLSAMFGAGMVAEPVAAQVVARPGAHPQRTAVVAANVALPAVMLVGALRGLLRDD